MAATDILISGLYYAVGHTVSVAIGGLDCGDYVVVANGTDGQVTVPINSDPDQLCNGAYLKTLDVGPWDTTTYGDLTTEVTLDIGGVGSATIYIPVAVGYAYPSAGQTMRPATEAQIKSQQGPGTGKLRKVHNYGILFGAVVGNAGGLQLGTNLTAMNAIQLKTKGGIPLTHNIVFQGVAYGPIKDTDSFDGQVCWYMSRCYPCVINSLNGFMETSEH